MLVALRWSWVEIDTDIFRYAKSASHIMCNILYDAIWPVNLQAITRNLLVFCVL